VFNEDRMLQYLNKDALEVFEVLWASGSKIDRKMADQVAEIYQNLGYHYGSHALYAIGFKPLTGATA